MNIIRFEDLEGLKLLDQEDLQFAVNISHKSLESFSNDIKSLDSKISYLLVANSILIPLLAEYSKDLDKMLLLAKILFIVSAIAALVSLGFGTYNLTLRGFDGFGVKAEYWLNDKGYLTNLKEYKQVLANLLIEFNESLEHNLKEYSHRAFIFDISLYAFIISIVFSAFSKCTT